MAAAFKIQGLDVITEYSNNLTSSYTTGIINQIASTGANSIEITPLLYVAKQGSNAVTAVPGKSETDADLIAGIKAAEAAGLSVVLKPAISGQDGTNSNALAPTDPAAFFASYQAQVVHMAAIAQATGVTTFSIGNEMSTLTGARYLPYWTSLIAAVRGVYSGAVTYAAATNEASSVSFWSQVDTIGVNMYPPLSASASPTVANLVAAWNSVPSDGYWASVLNYQSPVNFLQSLSTQYGKPALITETGYRSITGTASNPGDYKSAGVSDPQAQANAYQAAAQVWGSQTGSWFQGIEFLQGILPNPDASVSYSPLDKPAQAIVTQLFTGQMKTSGLTITGSTLAQTLDYANSVADNVIIGGLADQRIVAGSGNDTIFAGPASLAPLKTTTITVTGYGDVIGGVGAQTRLLVNGAQVGNAVTYTAAADPSGYQTYTFTFANTGPIASLDLQLMNAGSGRGLHVKSIDVNGVALAPAQAVNTSVPGTFDVYGGTPLHFDTTGKQAMFVGSGSANDTVVAGAGNDTVYGGAGTVTMAAGKGDDTFVGGTGASTVVFAGKAADYTIRWSGNTATVTDGVAGRDGIDTLTNITRVAFADKTVDLASLARPLAATLVTANASQTSNAVHYALTGSTGNTPYASQVTAYDGQGRIVGTSQYYAGGALYSSTTTDAAGASATQQYTPAGVPVQRVTVAADGSVDVKLYDAAGALSTDTATHADGTRDVYDYGLTGKPYASDHLAFNAAGTLIDTVQYNADGSTYAETKVLANGAVEQDQYVAGTLTQSLITGATSVETKTYAAGALVADKVRNTDGSSVLSTYGITGKPYTSDVMTFNAAGVLTDHKEYLASGALYAQQTVLANGSSKQDLYTAGQLTQSLITATNGTSETKTYAGGTLVTDLFRNLDGTRTQYDYAITGQPYASDVMTFNAAGTLTDVKRYLAGGALYAEVQTLADGSSKQDLYTAGQLSQSVITATGGASETRTYAGGALVTDLFRNQDGTRTQYDYRIAGKPYASDVMTFNAAGAVTDIKTYLASGAVYSETKTLSNGASQVDQYTAGQLSQSVITAPGGASETRTYAGGALVTDLFRNQDGTRTQYDYRIAGKPYTSDVMTFNAAGAVTDIKTYLASGALYNETKTLSNGASQVDQYTAGQLSQSVITATGGASETRTYANGALTADLFRNQDGTSALWSYGVTGKPYTSSEMILNKSGTMTELLEFNADGSRYLDQLTGSDGSVTRNLYSGGKIVQQTLNKADGTVQVSSNQAGLSLDGGGAATGARSLALYDASGRQTVSEVVASDGSLQITGLAHQVTLAGGTGNDTLTSFGGDTLAFNAQSGHDTIAKFYAGTGLYSDVITIKAAGIADMQHLSLTQKGADVLVGINAQSDILIKNTALSQLNAHNFAFG